MSDQLELGYLTPPDNTFWQWQDDAETIGWRDDKTIAFREELAMVLGHLAPHGLPRLGSLLLLLAATRKNWAVDGSEAGILAGLVNDLLSKDQQEEDAQLLDTVLSGLHRVRALDSSLRTPLEAKIALAEIVLDGCPTMVPKEEAGKLVSYLRTDLIGNAPLTEAEANPDVRSLGYGPVMLLRDLADLASGLERVTPEAVRVRMKTGLDALPLPAPVELESEELSPSQSARRLIDQLLESSEMGGLARVAKLLLASTALPRRLTEIEEQETGGFSDIANRGTPDRLLLSELAQDGLTLAVRVAMNEALYLHRETPPSMPRLRRELLIDCGVRAWGVPRVFAASAALALAATTPEGAGFAAFRGSGSRLVETDLRTEAGLTDHLAALEPDPHLADALPEFTKRIEESDEPVEAVLLTTDDALTDPAFDQALRSLELPTLYLATVSRTGEFRLIERRLRGEKLVRRAKIDVEQLYGGAERLVDKRQLDRLPAIFHRSPFPLLMPHGIDPKRAWFIGSWGALALTNDSRLVRWTERGKGPQQLLDGLPKGKLWWASPKCQQGQTEFVYGTPNHLQLVRVDLARATVDRTELECEQAIGMTYHNGALMCLTKDKVCVMDASGKLAAKLAIPSSLVWKGGRFFCDYQNAWHALSYDGSTATIDALPEFDTRGECIVSIWDSEGHEGPIALSSAGDLLSDFDYEGEYSRSPIVLSSCKLHFVSPDGLVVRADCDTQPSYNRHMEINLGEEDPYSFCNAHLPEARIHKLASPITLRNRFSSIGITTDGLLCLRSPKGTGAALRVRQGMPVLSPEKTVSDLHNSATFEAIYEEQSGYRLSEAVWPNGSRAVLDSRGLLHLQSSDESVPELSVVLAEGELTVWCSDATQFGNKYFLLDDESAPKSASLRRGVFDRTVTRFVEGIRA